MIYQLKISLMGVKKPPIWRRVLIDADITFDTLHQIIQVAMGWENCHLYSFGYKPYDHSLNISIPTPHDWEPPTANASKTKVSKYLNPQYPRMKYVYDFGDDWIHDLVLENVSEELDPNQKLPICLTAKGACPPEDCGGVWGYEDLKMLATKKDLTDQQIERLEWYGIDEDFDPKKVDIDYINLQLESLQRKQTKKRKIDQNKQTERVELLQKLITDFSHSKAGIDPIVKHAFDIINILVNNDVNLASGSPNIWAAAIVIFVQQNMFIYWVDCAEVYDYFGVKASGVQNRINIISDTISDEDYMWYDDDEDDHEDDDSEDIGENPLDDIIERYKAGTLKLPPFLEEVMKQLGLI